jgi:hypothetical protein
LSLATACPFLIFIVFRSSSTTSVHLLRNIPHFLVPYILAVTIRFGSVSLFILKYVHTILI